VLDPDPRRDLADPVADLGPGHAVVLRAERELALDVAPTIWRAGSCRTVPTVSEVARSGWFATSSPATVTRPESSPG
jgi:hypothetical protein